MKKIKIDKSGIQSLIIIALVVLIVCATLVAVLVPARGRVNIPSDSVYTVNFVDWNNDVIKTEAVKGGGSATSPTGVPLRPATEKFTYDFVGWDTDFDKVTGEMTVKATYSEIARKYTVSFLNWDGTVLKSEDVDYDATTTAPTNPTKVSTMQYNYTFDGWDKNLSNIRENEIITATYKEALQSYTVNFINWDGTNLKSETTAYGSSATAPQDPIRLADVFGTYTFSDWDSSFDNVTSELTIKATYDTVFNYHDVVFVNWDDEIIKTESVRYGLFATAPADPTKLATAQYTYTFEDWDSDFSDITTSITVKATYSSTINTYNVTFKDGDGNTMKTETIEYGSSATCPETATKAATAQYTFTFTGWDIDFDNIVSNTIVTATFSQTVNAYLVTFNNWDGSLITTESVNYGLGATAPATPTRISTVENTYTFSKWDIDFDEIIDNLTVTAVYNSHVRKYTVTFVTNGDSTIEDAEANYGSTYGEPTTPTKAGHSFDTWYSDEELTLSYNFDTLVERNLTLYGSWTTNSYNVRFNDWDGTEIETQVVIYLNAAIAPSDPSKLATAEHTFVFTGWDKTFDSIIGDTIVTAQYSQTVNEYTVTFINGDGTSMKTETLEYGSEITAPIETPTKIATVENTYAFSKWDIDFAIITGDVTITSEFTSSIRAYSVTFVTNGDSTIEYANANYGSTYAVPTIPTKAGHTFAAWYSDEALTLSYDFATLVESNITLYGSWATNSYNVRFNNWDGTEIDTQSIVYENSATAPESPTKLATTQYTYTFNGWDKTFDSITANIIVTAQYSEAINSYTVTFINGDGTTMKTETLEYGSEITAPIETPTKIATVGNTYAFSKWDIDFTVVTGNLTITSEFTISIRAYSVTFVTNGDSTIEDAEANYGSTYGEPTTPTKAGHSFDTWYSDEELTLSYNFDTLVERNLTLYGNWTVNSYNVRFNNWDGTEIDTQVIVYKNSATAPESPTKLATAQYTYTFNGWDIAFDSITANIIVTAQYSETINSYTVTFINGDGTTMKTETLEYGSEITAPVETPTKTSTVENTYAFSKWDIGFAIITGDVTITSEFTSSIRKYTVTFVTNGDSTIDKEESDYGSTYEVPTTPTKAGHTFAAWYSDEELTLSYNFDTLVERNITLYGSWTTNSYNVRFNNWDGTEIDTQSIVYENSATAPESPTKLATAQYTFTFNGWDKTFDSITANIIVTAQYSETINSYTVTFINGDGTSMKTETLEYGSEITAPIETPTKIATVENTYAFSKWDIDFTVVTGNLTITSEFISSIRKYTVTFVTNGDSTIDNVEADYGSTYEVPSTPTKAGHSFDAWYSDEALTLPYSFDTLVTGNLTLYAKWSITKYTVTFANWDGSELETQQISYGSSATQPSSNPTRKSTAEFLYTFNNWDKAFNNIIEDTTITAVFKGQVRSYTVRFFGPNGNILSNRMFKYGAAAIAPTGPALDIPDSYEGSYTFIGWDKDFEFVTDILDLYPVYELTPAFYRARFYDHDNTLLKEEWVEYRHYATPPETPTRESTAQYDYTFLDWTMPTLQITGNTNFNARYTPTLISYTITFFTGEGSAVAPITMKYGNGYNLPANPSRPTYEFIDWYADEDCTVLLVHEPLIADINAYARWEYVGTTGLKFELINSDTEYQVSTGTSTGSDIILPLTYKGLPVTTIKDYGFQGRAVLKTIAFTNNIKTIGAYAFAQTHMSSIEIPSSVTTIGDKAFIETYLRTIDIPSTVTTIGVEILYRCILLETIKLPARSPTGLFLLSDFVDTLYSTLLTTVVIQEGTIGVATRALDANTTITDLTIPSTVTSLPTEAFVWCISLTNITLPSTLESIGKWAFNNCKGITSLTLPEGLLSIVEYAFDGCENLKTIILPSTLTSIGEWAFRNCTSLSKVILNATIPPVLGTNAFHYKFNAGTNYIITTLTIIVPSTYVTTYKEADVWSVYEAYIYGPTSSISYQTNEGTIISSVEVDTCTILSAPTQPTRPLHSFNGWFANYDLTVPYSFEASIKGDITIYADWTYVGTFGLKFTLINNDTEYKVGKGTMDATTLAIPTVYKGKPVTTIEVDAFRNCTTLISVVIPNSIKDISDCAFYECNALTTIEISNSVTTIGNYVFANCYGLLDFDIPSSVISIGNTPLTGCYNLVKLSAPSKSIGAPFNLLSFFGASWSHVPTSLKTVVVREGASGIDIRCFFHLENIESVTMHNTVTYIGSEAFDTCTSLSEVVLSTAITHIGQNAFSNCTSLTSITLPQGLKEIGEGAFAVCIFTDIVLPSSIEYIGPYSFFATTTLKTVTILALTPPVAQVNMFTYGISGFDTAIIENLKILVDNSKVAAYKAAIYWVQYKDNIFGITSFASFNTDGGTSVSTQEIAFNSTATQPNVPTKTGHTFENWYTDASLTIPYDWDTLVTIDFALYAKWTINTYNVTFNNWDGTELNTQEVTFSQAATAPESPTKDGNAQYTYTFNGWDKTFSSINSDIVITATYTQTVNAYLVTFNNWDDSQITTESVDYGSAATAPATPFRPSTLDSTYTFSNWDVDFDVIIGNLTVTALYNTYVRIYTVTFITNCDTQINDATAEYGSAIDAPIAITKLGHEFDNWYLDAGYIDVYSFSQVLTKDITIYANWIYVGTTGLLFTLINDDTEYEVSQGTMEATEVIIPSSYNDLPVTTVALAGFDDCRSITSVQLPNSITTLKDQAFSYCTKLVTINLPSSITAIGQSAFSTCSALESVTIPDAVTIIDEGAFFSCASLSNLVIGSGITTIGETAFHSCKSLTTLNIPEGVESLGTFSFANCTSLTAVILPATLSVLNNNVFALCTELQTVTIYATTPPVSQNDIFLNTHENLVVLVPAASVSSYKTATFFSSIARHIFGITSTVAFQTYGGTEIISVDAPYGTAITTPANPTKDYHTFDGWYIDESFTTLYEFSTLRDIDITLYANWIIYNYSVVFKNEDGTTLTSQSVDHGSSASAPESNPTKTATDEFTYTFSGWDKTFDNITAPLIVTAQYSEIVNEYSVTFNNWDDSFIATVYVNYGSGATAPANPTRANEAPYAYTFSGWDTIFSNITGNLTVTAQYTQELLKHTVSFVTNDVTTIEAVEVISGEAITAPTAPTKIGYEFIDWYSDEALTTLYIFTTAVISNITLYARWDLATEGLAYRISNDPNYYSVRIGTATDSYINIPSKYNGKLVGVLELSGFANLSTLTGIFIPEGVYDIPDETFDASNNIVNIDIAEGNTNYKVIDGALLNYEGTYLRFYAKASASTTYTVPSSVLSIGDKAFKRAKNLVTVTLSNSIMANSKFKEVFSYCTSLETVFFESGSQISQLGFQCFYYCTSLKNIEIPESVTSLGSEAFSYCNSIEQIDVPASVTNMGSYVFSYCTSLELVIMNNTVPPTSESGHFYGGSPNLAICVPNASVDTYKTTGHWQYSASRIYGITSTVSFNSNGGSAVTSMEAPYGNAITEPTDPTRLGYMFDGWYTDEALTVFYDFATLRKANIILYANWCVASEGLMYSLINDDTEYDVKLGACRDPYITIPSRYNGKPVTALQEHAFSWETFITGIYIPATIKDIFDYALYEISSLVNIDISEDNLYFKTVDGVLFSKDGKTLVLYPEADPRTTYAIPSGVTHLKENSMHKVANLISVTVPNTIIVFDNGFMQCPNLVAVDFESGSVLNILGPNSFFECTSLTTINLPNSVEYFYDNIFYGCTSLENITIPANVATLGMWMFEGCTALVSITMLSVGAPGMVDRLFFDTNETFVIYVPTESVAYYKMFWSEYADRIFAIV